MAKRSTQHVKVKGATEAEKPLVDAARRAGAADAEARNNPAARAPARAPTPPEDEDHTRLATPSDPEAVEQQKEVQAVNKATGRAPVEKVQNAKDLPNAADTPRAARDKQQAQFDKADEAGKAEMIGATRARGAAGVGF